MRSDGLEKWLAAATKAVRSRRSGFSPDREFETWGQQAFLDRQSPEQFASQYFGEPAPTPGRIRTSSVGDWESRGGPTSVAESNDTPQEETELPTDDVGQMFGMAPRKQNAPRPPIPPQFGMDSPPPEEQTFGVIGNGRIQPQPEEMPNQVELPPAGTADRWDSQNTDALTFAPEGAEGFEVQGDGETPTVEGEGSTPIERMKKGVRDMGHSVRRMDWARQGPEGRKKDTEDTLSRVGGKKPAEPQEESISLADIFPV